MKMVLRYATSRALVHRLKEDHRTVAQATASLYSVKTYEEQIAYKEMTLRNDLFMKLPSLIRRVYARLPPASPTEGVLLSL